PRDNNGLWLWVPACAGTTVEGYTSAFPRRECTRVLLDRRPSETGGRRECRMLAAPASLACKEGALLRTQATTGQPEQPALPAQRVTAYTWCAGLSGHRRLTRRVGPPGPTSPTRKA